MTERPPSLDDRNIVLTGFMGTGKTTVGRLLADRLGFEFIDTDHVIEARHGTIAAIFANHGESAFRDLEREFARELADRNRLVISTGGRMMLDPANVSALSENGRVFCLVATPEQIMGRVLSDADGPVRPLLALADPRERIVELLAERRDGYGRFPQLHTGTLTPGEVVDELVGVVTANPHRIAIDNPAGMYEYVVGAGLLPFTRQLAGIAGPMIVVTSADVAERYLPSLGPVEAVVTLPAGRHKTLRSVEAVYDALLAANVDRAATIVSLGDSVVGDVAGFAAATYLRGLDLVHCPTDLIAMIDTSIGGKVGLDVPQGKNLLGLYKQPKAVIADVATLQTLPPRQLAAGMAEVVKHAVIGGGTLLDHVETLTRRHTDTRLPEALAGLQTLVAQAIQVKVAIVQDAPFDQRRRVVLNFGHTFAYGLEHVAGPALLHGEAVGLGMVAAARLSERLGIAASGVADRVECLVAAIGLATKPEYSLPVDDVIGAMQRDKKRQAGQLRFVLLRDVGDVFLSENVPLELVRTVLAGL